MSDRIRSPELAEGLSDFFDLDGVTGPGILAQKDVSLVYDVGRLPAAREGYDPVPIIAEIPTTSPLPTPETAGARLRGGGTPVSVAAGASEVVEDLSYSDGGYLQWLHVRVVTPTGFSGDVRITATIERQSTTIPLGILYDATLGASESVTAISVEGYFRGFPVAQNTNLILRAGNFGGSAIDVTVARQDVRL